MEQPLQHTQAIPNTSGMGKDHPIPDGVTGWSWGAFLLNWIWAIGNRVWIGLLALIPYVGFVMVIILAIKGREWAWQNHKWDSVEHFQRVQRQWAIWGIVIFCVFFILGFAAAILAPIFIATQNPEMIQEFTDQLSNP